MGKYTVDRSELFSNIGLNEPDISRTPKEEPSGYINEAFFNTNLFPYLPVASQKEVGHAIARGIDYTSASIGGAMEMFGIPGGKKIKELYTERAERPEIQKPEYLQEGTILDHPERVVDPRWWVNALGENLPTMVATMASGAGMANLAFKGVGVLGKLGPRIAGLIGAFTSAFTLESGAAFNEAKQEMLDMGYDEDRAHSVAFLEGVSVGLTNAVLEVIPFDNLLKMPGGKHVLIRAIRQGLLEGGTEAIQENVQMLAADYGHAPDVSTKDRLARTIEASLAGFGLGGITGAAVKREYIVSDKPISDNPQVTPEDVAGKIKQTDQFSVFDEEEAPIQEESKSAVQVVEGSNFNTGMDKQQVQGANRIRMAEQARQEVIRREQALNTEITQQELEQEALVRQRQMLAQKKIDAERQIENKRLNDQRFFNALKTERGALDLTSNVLRTLEADEKLNTAAKPLREVHMALSIGEDSIKKLKQLQYKMREASKTIPGEKYQILTDTLSKVIDSRIAGLEYQEQAQERSTKQGEAAREQESQEQRDKGKYVDEYLTHRQARSNVATEYQGIPKKIEDSRVRGAAEREAISNERAREALKAAAKGRKAQVQYDKALAQEAEERLAKQQADRERVEYWRKLRFRENLDYEQEDAEVAKAAGVKFSKARAVADPAQVVDAINRDMPGNGLKFDGYQETGNKDEVYYQFTPQEGPAFKYTFYTKSLDTDEVRNALTKKIMDATPVQMTKETPKLQPPGTAAWARMRAERSALQKEKPKARLPQVAPKSGEAPSTEAWRITRERLKRARADVKFSKEINPEALEAERDDLLNRALTDAQKRKINDTYAPLIKEAKRITRATGAKSTLTPKEFNKLRESDAHYAKIFDILDRLQKVAVQRAHSIVARSQSELPTHITNNLSKTDVVKAAYDVDNDIVYFVTDNITNEKDAITQWIHEQVGHRGVSEVFGAHDIDFQEFANSVEKLLSTAKDYRDVYGEVVSIYGPSLKGKSREERTAILVDETLARLSERLSLTKRNLIYQKFRTFVNKWLKKFGIGVRITKGDIEAILQTARNRVMQGEERAWLEFKHSHEDYKKWAKEILKKNPKAVTWYTNHQELVKSVFGKDSDIFNAILAITSPISRVDSNVAWAIETYLYLNGKAPHPKSRFPNMTAKKINQWLGGEFAKSFESSRVKVDEFLRALLGDPNATVNDRWMYRVFFGESIVSQKDVEAVLKGTKKYVDLDSRWNVSENTAAREELSRLAKELSKETNYNWTPREVQAVLWTYKQTGKDTIETIDYANALTKKKRSLGNKTPLEYLYEKMGDKPIGEVHKRVKTTALPKESKLDKMHLQQLDRQGYSSKEAVRERSRIKGTQYITHYSKEPRNLIKPTGLGEGYQSYSRNDVGARMDAHTEQDPYIPLAYYYAAGVQPEPGVGSGKPHQINLKGRYIYDLVADPLDFNGKANKRIQELQKEAQKKYGAPGPIFAHRTNILAKLIQDAGFDGYSQLSTRGDRWFFLFGPQEALGTVETTVRASDVVESVETVAQNVSTLYSQGKANNQGFERDIREIIHGRYPEIKIQKTYNTVARFGAEGEGATSGTMEYGLNLDLAGPLPAIRSLLSEIGLAKSQRMIFIEYKPELRTQEQTKLEKLRGAVGQPNGTRFKFRIKRELDLKGVQSVIDRLGIRDFNISESNGIFYVDQFIGTWESDSIVKDFERLYKEIGDFSFRERYRIYSEALGDLDGDLDVADTNYREHILPYFGERGEEIYDKAKEKGQKYIQAKRRLPEAGSNVQEGSPSRRGEGINTLNKTPKGREERVTDSSDSGDIRFSKTKDWTEDLSPILKEITKNIGYQEVTPRQTFNKTHMSLLDRAIQQIADDKHVLRVLERTADPEKAASGYVSHRMLSSFPTIFQQFLEHGTPVWDKDSKWINIDTGGPSLFGSIQKLGDTQELFLLRMLAKSAKEMQGKDRENLFGKNLDDTETIETILKETESMETDTWRAVEKDLKAINSRVLDFMEDTGMIDPEGRKVWERETYIPFTRIIEDDLTGDIEALFRKSGGKNIKDVIQKLKGGKSNVGDPLNNLVNTYSFMIHEALTNVARKKSLTFMIDLDQAVKVSPETTGDSVVKIFHKGKAQKYFIRDPILLDSLVGMDAASNGRFTNWLLLLPRRALTVGVTIAPAFRVANFIRDTVNTALIEKNFVPFYDSFRALHKAWSNSPEMVEFAVTGGSFAGAYHSRDIGRKSTPKSIDRLKKSTKKPQRSNLNPAKWWELWQRVGEASENAARLGLYMRERSKGAPTVAAGFKAKDLLDFHMSGKSEIMRFCIRTIPFLNARIQGLYKVGRTAMDKKTRRNLLFRGAMLATVAAIVHAINADDDRYKELQDHERYQYLHFFDVPGLGHVRIPLPFELGAAFGTFPVMTGQFLNGTKTAQDYGKYMMFTLKDTFRFDPVPQFAKPFYVQATGRDAFTGIPIVPMGEKNLEPFAQWGPNTSKTAREIGGIINLSPRRIDQFIKDWFAWGGQTVLHLLDMGLEHIRSYPEDPAVTVGDRYYSGIGRFIKGTGPARYTKAESRFYDLLTEADTVYRTINTYRSLSDQRAYKRKHRDILRNRDLLRSGQKQLRTINQRIKLIHSSTTKSAKQKRKEIDRLLERRNNIIKRVVSRIK